MDLRGIKEEAARLAGHLLDDSSSGNSRYLAMKRLVEEIALGSKINCHAVPFFMVADEMFADGEINWGRVVTLYAFAKEKSNELDAERLGDYVGNKLGFWILTQGGWRGFDDYFSVDKKSNIFSNIAGCILNMFCRT